MGARLRAGKSTRTRSPGNTRPASPRPRTGHLRGSGSRGGSPAMFFARRLASHPAGRGQAGPGTVTFLDGLSADTSWRSPHRVCRDHAPLRDRAGTGRGNPLERAVREQRIERGGRPARYGPPSLPGPDRMRAIGRAGSGARNRRVPMPRSAGRSASESVANDLGDGKPAAGSAARRSSQFRISGRRSLRCAHRGGWNRARRASAGTRRPRIREFRPRLQGSSWSLSAARRRHADGRDYPESGRSAPPAERAGRAARGTRPSGPDWSGRRSRSPRRGAGSRSFSIATAALRLALLSMPNALSSPCART